MRRIASLFCVGLLVACGEANPVVDSRYAMGTILEITLRGAPQEEADALYTEVARLEALLSRYDPASEVSRINESGGGGFDVSPELAELLAIANGVREQSAGAFDVAVGAWVALWEEAARAGAPPSATAIDSVRARVGDGAYTVSASGKAITADGVVIDLGGIAKGYALDRLESMLRERGVSDALLNFGQSSYWALGQASRGRAWTLLLQHPKSGYAGTLELRDRALSVSAALGQRSAIAGVDYGHIIDPRSGMPLVRDAQAVVLASHAALAEGLSTAFLVLGSAHGLAMVERIPDCEALWIDGEGFKTSTGFVAATAFAPIPAN